MADETLIDKEISEMGNQLLDPFEPECVKGASYDIRVGPAVRVPSPNAGCNVQWVALGIPPLGGSVSIPPGSTCIIQSLEKVHMPKGMKGRLALRAFHARRLVFFPGGVIDPGYDDYLFLPIANLGDTPIELKYGEAIVSAEFTRLNKEAVPYQRSKEPPHATSEHPIVFDRVKLSKEVEEHGQSIEKIKNRLDSGEILASASQRILDLVVLAAVAGGVIAVTAILLPGLSRPWNFVALGIGAVFIIAVVIFLIKSMPHRPGA